MALQERSVLAHTSAHLESANGHAERVERVNAAAAHAVEQAFEFHETVGFDRSYVFTVDAPFSPMTWSYPNNPLQDGESLIAGVFSGVSWITELKDVSGEAGETDFDYDNLRLSTPRPAGLPVQFPPFIGYEEAGIDPNTGQWYGGNYGRKVNHIDNLQAHVTNPESRGPLLLKVPESINPLLATEVAQMGPIGAQGPAVADTYFYGFNHFENAYPKYTEDVEVGKSLAGQNALVIGAGVVGMEVAMFAQKAGANVMVAEANPNRLQLPASLGMETVQAKDSQELAVKVKSTWKTDGQVGADVVFECTGALDGLVSAVKAARRQHPVIQLSFYKKPRTDEEKAVYARLMQVMEQEQHKNRIPLMVAQIQNLPPGLSQRQLALKTIDLLQEPKYSEASLGFKSHLIPMSKYGDLLRVMQDPAQAELIRPYALDPEKNQIMQPVFYFDTGLIPQIKAA